MRPVRPFLSPPDPVAFKLTVRVYYEDTDAAGVVYYANYLRYCERARTEWLRSMGYSQHALLSGQGLAFVVRSVQAEFRSSAHLDDTLRVVTSVVKLGHASLTFAQTILRDEELILESRVSIACVDTRRKRPCPIPPELRTQFQECLST